MSASAPPHYLHWINAFTTGAWHSGNTAAVVRTRQPLSEEKMQLLAIQHQVAETAFVYPLDERQHEYALRWFSPVTEVDLCGHATLAAAHVLQRVDRGLERLDRRVPFGREVLMPWLARKATTALARRRPSDLL